MFFSFDCCELSVSGLCFGLISRPEESTECGDSEYNHESSIMRNAWPLGILRHGKENFLGRR
jgi:hypothetical protein